MSRRGGTFTEIETPPTQTEELIIVSLDDYKYGLDANYTSSAGLDQLSSFFICYRPNDQQY